MFLSEHKTSDTQRKLHVLTLLPSFSKSLDIPSLAGCTLGASPSSQRVCKDPKPFSGSWKDILFGLVQGLTLVADSLPPEQAGDISCPGLFGGHVGGLQHKQVPGLATTEPDLKAQLAFPTAFSEAKVCHLHGQGKGA